MLPTIVKAPTGSGDDGSHSRLPTGSSAPVKTEDLLSHFESDFSSFLDGFLAAQGLQKAV